MNMNMNPKVLHFALESVQLLGTVATITGFLGHIPLPGPWSGVVTAVAAIATASATAIKTNVIGNINPTNPTS